MRILLQTIYFLQNSIQYLKVLKFCSTAVVTDVITSRRQGGRSLMIQTSVLNTYIKLAAITLSFVIFIHVLILLKYVYPSSCSANEVAVSSAQTAVCLFPSQHHSLSQQPPWLMCPRQAPLWSTRPPWWRSICSLWQPSQTLTHVC